MIGGQTAEPGTFPWMAYVLDFHANEVGQCSGTVVAPNLILTAGHCVEDMQTGAVNEASDYRVMTGNVNWAVPETERQVSDVTRVIPCPCFDRHTLIGDVALLQLSTPTTSPPVTLAPNPPGGTAALLAGWGKTYYSQKTPVERLQWAQTVVQGSRWCEREASAFSPASDVCAIDSPDRQTGACNGDSGGPLLVPEPSATGGMVQIGVVSHGASKCATTSPTVFTRVDAISSWVRGWVQTLAASPPASALLPANTVAAPTLPGVASSRSVSLGHGAISFVLGCDSEGGVCSGTVDAAFKVRVRLMATGYGRTTMSTHTHRVTLTSVSFTIAPGAHVVIHSPLSTQSQALLSRLGNGPLDLRLAGQGVTPRIVRLIAR